MDVSLCNLTRDFGNTRAVDGISFTFSSSQIVGFIGPNGAGKTTTMRILATLDEPTEGDALIDGHSVVQDPEKTRMLLGYVPDSLPTHRDMTVHEYLDFFARAYGVRSGKRRAALDDIEEFTGLTTIRDKPVAKCSKGMKQRVSLARALVHDPPVLVLDEPAAGLDPRARVELRELLKALAERGKAILISSHILTELSQICDGAAIIERGRLVHAGAVEDLTQLVSQAKVAIRPVDGVEELRRAVLQMPHVVDATIVGPDVEVEVEADGYRPSDLLTALIHKGFAIEEFKRREVHLEEVFMNITKGDLQ